MIDDIAGMKRGECWLLSPGAAMLKFRVRNRVTYHAGRTPKPGERAVNVDKFSVTEAVKTLKTLFSQKQVARKQEVQDLAEAKKRIRDLERELRAAAHHKPPRIEIRDPNPRLMQNAIERNIAQARRSIAAEVRRSLEASMRDTLQKISGLSIKISGPEIQIKEHGGDKKLAEPTGQHLAAPKVPRNHPDSNNHLDVSGNDLSGPEKKILRALGELLSIGKEAAPKNMVAAWSGYSPIGGAFGNPLGALRSKNLITYPIPGQVSLTDDGRLTLGPPPDRDEIVRRIEAICTGPERKILSVVIDQNGEEIAKNELAERAGYAPVGGAFGNPLGALRTKGLIDYPRPGVVKAADWLLEVQ